MTTLTLTTDGRLRTTTSVLRAMQLSPQRVALVPETALLLAGDHVSLRIEVAPGAHLEVVETSGTVAYDMRGGSAAWDVSITVGAGGSLVWKGLPFVASEGSSVTRATDVTLGLDARLLLRETLVLGRSGQLPGHVHSRLDADVLVEELDSAVLPCRVLDSLLAVGYQPAEGAMTLESGDHLYRWLGDETHLSSLQSLTLE